MSKKLDQKENKSKRNTRSSFLERGSEIMKDNVKEGRMPSGNKNQKRKEVMGSRPSGYLSPKKKKEKQKEESESEEEEEEEEKKTTKKSSLSIANKEYQQDVLTKQAIDEIKDNIKLFKMDISKYIQELRDEQDKIELGEIRKQIKSMEDGIEKNLKATRNESDKDFKSIQNAFFQFRDDVFELIDNIVKEHEEKLDKLMTEIKNYEGYINKKFTEIKNRQQEYINLLKEILDRTKDPKINELVKRFLVDDYDLFESNKRLYEEEYREYMDKEKKRLGDIEKEKLKIRIKLQEAEIGNLAKEEEELKMLEDEVREKEKEFYNLKEEEILNRAKEEIKQQQEDEFRQKMREEQEKVLKEEEEMEKAMIGNQNRPNQLYVLQPPPDQKDNKNYNIEDTSSRKPSSKKMTIKSKSNKDNISEPSETSRKTIPNSNKESPQLTSMKEFYALFTRSENEYKKFLKTCVSKPIQSLIKNAQFLDITQYQLSQDVNKKDISETIAFINNRLKELMESMILAVTSGNINVNVKNYLRFILRNNSFVPFIFFSNYELSRLYTKDGFIINYNNSRQKMVLAFYIIVKAIIKNYFIDFNFIPEKDKDKLDNDTINNFKVIASILFITIIKMFRKIDIITNIVDLDQFRCDQKNIDPKVIMYITPIENKLISGMPDTDANTVEYISHDLFTESDLSVYFSGVKETKFELERLIGDFLDELTTNIGSY